MTDMFHDDLHAISEVGGSTLQRIKDGGEVLLALALTRADEAISALKRGDFIAASNRIGELHSKVQTLATAQHHMGQFKANTVIVRARELHEGQFLCTVGIVATVERRTEPNPMTGESDTQVFITCREPVKDSEPMQKTWQFDGDQELVIWAPGSKESQEREAAQE